ncbi:hypothetical protein N7931_07550 [Catenovulum sp. 2E275]|uniref:hypothetical protein n=1 Tax=Catenovulum sp. 2E275 TaxID=2980497 RepID=UPI0021D1AA63|nr:hypothetical protein [Catenovulum sp. 2E275]MCU4675488.1 hypothetical protein [Catenovulum sp. 2E275]
MINLFNKIKAVCLVVSLLGFSSVVLAAPPTIWGAKHKIPYMPYSPVAYQIIYVTVFDGSDANISVIAFDDRGNKFDLEVVSTASVGTVTQLSPVILSELEAHGFTSSRAAFEITVNNPNAIVYASYSINGSYRGFVPVERTYILKNPNPETEE